MEGSNENRSKRLEPLGPGTARILCVGLGTMGLPMATNRVRAGFAVTGFDLDARSVHAFVQAGGRRGSDAHAAAQECDVLVTMLPDDRIVHDVLAGYGADDTPGSMLRACETRGGVRLKP